MKEKSSQWCDLSGCGSIILTWTDEAFEIGPWLGCLR